MVAQDEVRTYGVNQLFRFVVEGISSTESSNPIVLDCDVRYNICRIQNEQKNAYGYAGEPVPSTFHAVCSHWKKEYKTRILNKVISK